MIYKPQKIQLSLTIQFALFFILVAAYIYYYFSQKFEEEVLDKFQFKSEIMAKFIEQNPQFFWQSKIEDKTQLNQLMFLNDVNYFVLEDAAGRYVDAVNLDLAEHYTYVAANNDDNISFDETVYRVVIPVTINHIREGKVYLGFNAGLVAVDLKRKTLLTALFSLSILLAGMVFTYFLSSISFKPITKLIWALSKSDIKEQKVLLTKFKNNEIGLLAKKIYNILNELDKSSNEVTNLNERLNELFREKINELDVEINHRKKVETNLRKTEEMFRLFFENAPIGMIIISKSGKIVKTNRAFCYTVGYDEIELVGMHVKEFFNDNSARQLKSTYQMIMENESLDLESRFTKKDGRKISALVKTIKINDEEGEQINTLLQVLDITQIKLAEAELVKALENAKESDRLKSAFLAQMSHEIRTPLNVILPSIPLLADEVGSKDSEIVTILNAVANASKRLQRTIDMILSMSAVQSGNYKANFEIIDLAEELNNLTMEFKPITMEKGLELYYKNTSKNSDISADRYTIGQVFQNLIGNAIKYTHSGHVSVSIEDKGEDEVVVKIADSGIGISEKYLKNLFTPFSQEDSGQTRRYEGNGLGLALVKEYIALNKGKILVQSEKNKGSVFSVVFDKKIIRVMLEDTKAFVDEIAN